MVSVTSDSPTMKFVERQLNGLMDDDSEEISWGSRDEEDEDTNFDNISMNKSDTVDSIGESHNEYSDFDNNVCSKCPLHIEIPHSRDKNDNSPPPNSILYTSKNKKQSQSHYEKSDELSSTYEVNNFKYYDETKIYTSPSKVAVEEFLGNCSSDNSSFEQERRVLYRKRKREGNDLDQMESTDITNPYALNLLSAVSLNYGERAIVGCRCTKTKCLKLYCDCFQGGKTCKVSCTCLNCRNTEEESGPNGVRTQVIKEILKRRPDAFQEKVRDPDASCACKNSRCLKKYCKCYIQGRACLDTCACRDCKNQSSIHLIQGVQSQSNYSDTTTSQSPKNIHDFLEKVITESSSQQLNSSSVSVSLDNKFNKQYAPWSTPESPRSLSSTTESTWFNEGSAAV